MKSMNLKTLRLFAMPQRLLEEKITYATLKPAADSADFTSAIFSTPKWKTLAASTPSAPACAAATKSWADPAPPDAINGALVTSRAAASISKSKPRLVPSKSTEFNRTSPAPKSTACVIHSSASRPVPCEPPCVVTSYPDFVWPGSQRRASTERTVRPRPHWSAISLSNSGRATAAVAIPTFLAPAASKRCTSATDRTPPPTVMASAQQLSIPLSAGGQVTLHVDHRPHAPPNRNGYR